MNDNKKLIDVWFPCAAVDAACASPAGSGRNEKAIFTWFASRPIAQARAAVATALLTDREDHRNLVDEAVSGDAAAIEKLAALINDRYPHGRPVVLDVFSGRGIIPLEAARLGATAVGLDLSPVATLAGRILADYALRDWSTEPPLPWSPSVTDGLFDTERKPRLVRDLEVFLAEVERRFVVATEPYYPRNPDGTFPWGYVWAISMPCDACGRRFPLLGNLALRYPYRRTNDLGQSLRLVVAGDTWSVDVVDGPPQQAPTYSATDLGSGRKRK
jgi:adenine-specific DNA methylase